MKKKIRVRYPQEEVFNFGLNEIWGVYPDSTDKVLLKRWWHKLIWKYRLWKLKKQLK